MNKHKLTELEILNERIKREKIKAYSDAIVLLPGITTLTVGALAENNIGMAIGGLMILGGAAISTEKDIEEKPICQKVINHINKK